MLMDIFFWDGEKNSSQAKKYHHQQKTKSDMNHVLLIAMIYFYMRDLNVNYWLVTPEDWVQYFYSRRPWP